MRKKLQGQTAIITGGSRGIGAAAARLLVQSGAAVVLAARGADEVAAQAENLRRAGGRAVGVAADVTDIEQVEEIVETALDQFDRLDILINCAGVIWPLEEVTEADPEEWTYNLHVNLVGPYLMARNALPVMLEQGYGRIIHLSGKGATQPIAGASAYCAAQAGVDMLTRVLALEVAGTGVTVNSLDPGDVDTELQADIRSVDTSESRLDFSYAHTVFAEKQLISVEETARLLYWLAGPWSRGHNGEVFRSCDAAWTAQVTVDLG